MSSSVFPYPNTCIPGGLAKISYQSSDSRSPSPVETSSADSPQTTTSSGKPHPYSISPSNTTALFTRASSVMANGGAIKKSRAPPSGPISTKDFIPPDVSGLSKREARLVKNRAAAFLSRQRKREEFELLEVRCDSLEQENAQLKSLLTGSNITLDSPTDNQAEIAAIQRQFTSELESVQAAHALELVSLQNKLAQATQELSVAKTKLEKSVARETVLKGQLGSGSSFKADAPASASPSTVFAALEDSETEEEDSTTKKSAGSMAFMVLLFSLSTLLSNGQQQPPTRGRSSSTANDAVRPALRSRSPSFALGYPAYDALTSSTSLGSSSGLGYLDYQPSSDFSLDSLLSSSADPLTGFLNDDSLFDLTSGSSTAQFEDFLLPPSNVVPSSPSLSATSAESTTSTIVSDLTRQCALSGGVPSSVKSTGPNSFEFVVQKPEDKTSVRVCVKSNVPFPKFEIPSSLEAPSQASQSIKASTLGTTMPSPVKFQPDDDLDSLVDLDADFEMKDWLADDATTIASTPSPLAAPSLKRKKVTVELTKRPAKRLRGDDFSENAWDIGFTEQEDELTV